MLSYIFILPSEVVGQNVIDFLNLKDLVQLDTAIMEHKYRTEFLELLTNCSPVAIPQNINASKEELLWFKQRKCSIKEMKISLSQSDYFDVDTSMADRVILELDRKVVPVDMENLIQSHIVSTITIITILGEQDNELIHLLFSLMPKLKQLTVNHYAQQKTYIKLWKPSPSINPMLHTFHCRVMNLTDDTTQFIYQQGRHLKSLELICVRIWEVDPNDFLEDLGRNCPNLVTLKVRLNLAQKEEVVLESGIMALVKNCLYLQTLDISAFDLSVLAIDAIAEHCTQLQKLSLYSTNILTLITLSKHRIPQEVLNIPWIPIPSAEVAAQCAHALSRIQRLQPTTAMCTDIPSLYIGYLTSLRELSLSTDLTNENTIEVLRAVAEHCRQVEEVDICARTDEIVEQLITLATFNPRLTSLTLHKAPALTDAALIELTKCCHKLSKIHIRGCPLITDTGIIALSRSSPNISLVYLANCPGLSNDSMSAISENCKYLQCFMLQQCNQVTKAGLKPLVLSCRHLSYMVLTHNYMSEATRARLLAKRSKKPTKYAKLDLILSDPFI